MNWLTFKRQEWLMAGIMFFCFMLATLTNQGVFANVGWVLVGLLFTIHPVCPETWKWKYDDNENRIKRDLRTGGVVVIFIASLPNLAFEPGKATICMEYCAYNELPAALLFRVICTLKGGQHT